MAKITKHFFEHNNRKYFRGNAENAQLGSYGEKKDPIGPDAYLDVESIIKRELIAPKMNCLGTVGIDWNLVGEVNGRGKAFVNVLGIKGEKSGEISVGAADTGNYKLVGFSINSGPLKKLLNTEADGARKFLEREGRDGRVVSEIWVVMSGKTSSAFNASANFAFSGSVLGVGLDVTSSGTAAGTKTVTLSPGSTFAYLMTKVKEWNKDRTRIVDLEPDYKGLS